jgi:hypothetical protein
VEAILKGALICLSIASLCSCQGERATDYRIVNTSEYVDLDKCWRYRGSSVVLFVTDVHGGKLIPYAISPYCGVVLPGYGREDSVMAMAKALPLASDNGRARAAGIVSSELGGNTVDHVPLPRRSRPLSLVYLSLQKLQKDGFVYYRIGKIYEWCGLGLTLGVYQRLSNRDRGLLVARKCSTVKQ